MWVWDLYSKWLYNQLNYSMFHKLFHFIPSQPLHPASLLYLLQENSTIIGQRMFRETMLCGISRWNIVTHDSVPRKILKNLKVALNLVGGEWSLEQTTAFSWCRCRCWHPLGQRSITTYIILLGDTSLKLDLECCRQRHQLRPPHRSQNHRHSGWPPSWLTCVRHEHD